MNSELIPLPPRSWPGAISRGAIRPAAPAGPTLENVARSLMFAGTPWSSSAPDAPIAMPFFVVPGVPMLPGSGMLSLFVSWPLFPAEMKTIASGLSRRNWSTSIALPL